MPEIYIDAINKLIGKNGLYPSRSELIRCAVREFLIKELKMAKNIIKYSEPELEDVFDAENFVRVPIDVLNENNEPVREFKTYKIVKMDEMEKKKKRKTFFKKKLVSKRNE